MYHITYLGCETCEDYGKCGCDDWRERYYLHNEGKDCYRPNRNADLQEENTKVGKIPTIAEIYEAENEWEDRVSIYRCW